MDLIKRLQNKNVTCVIVSPHQDDAVLSCGGLIAQLVGKTNITIINVFTKAHDKPYTLSAKQFLRYSKISDAQKLYAERAIEDNEVLSALHVAFVNLDFQDALFRMNKKTSLIGTIIPELDHIYPTYRWHVLNKVPKYDHALVELKKKLKQYNNKNTIVFAPIGIGGHSDHVIARRACEEVFKNIILYSDFPYNIRLNDTGETTEKGIVYKVQPDMKQKKALIKKYKTQFDGLFPDGIVPDHEEIYITNITL